MGKVLVVEDDGPTGMLISRVLEDAGHEVVVARNAERALVLFESDPPSILLTDIGLGGTVDGLALAREIRARRPSTRIMLFSGQQSEDLALAREERVCFTVKQKPLNLSEVLTWIGAP